MKRLIISVLSLALCLALTAPAIAYGSPAPVRIAMIDSGISTRHIDASHVLPGRNYVFPEKNTEDRIGHGTATAGMILGAAEQGVKGVWPEAELVPLVVVDAYPSGVVENGGTEALCSAILDAVDVFGCRIINVSLSTRSDDPELREAVAYAEHRGALVVSAVGNDGADGTPTYPAAYAAVVAVGSANEDWNGAADFSQPGADVLAPGTRLVAATNRNSLTPTTLSGTSYSCALVSGCCARLLSERPELTNAALRAALAALAVDLGEPGFDAETGWGLLRTDRPLGTTFLDVPDGSEAAETVLAAAARGILRGTSDAVFRPDAEADRASAVTALWRMAGSPYTGIDSGFTDADRMSWYAPALSWAASEGVVYGYDDGAFGPHDGLSREQLAAMLYRRTHGTAEGSLDEALRWAVGEGLFPDPEEQPLPPGGGMSRAQLAAVLLRYGDRG